MDAIKLSRRYDVVDYRREDLLWDKEKLLEFGQTREA